MVIDIRHLKNKNYFQLIVLAITSFIMPFYICDTNRYNLLFAMAEIPLLILLLMNLKKMRVHRNMGYIVLVILYFLTFLYYDIFYLKCYWALCYKVGSFLLLWDFDSCESYAGIRKDSLYSELTDTILSIFSFTVILSLISNIIGVDAIFLDVNQFHLRSAKSGVFLDERLTWVFMHKSSYGLLLVLALALLMKRRNFLFRRLWICIYFIAAIRINSMVSIVCMVMVLFAYYIKTKELDKKTMIKLFFAFFVGLIIAGAVFYVVESKRNVSSLGDRAYIWAIYADSLAKYPHGMGKSFFSDSFWLAAGGRYINNFHNVFFNEMIHYSVPVGIMFIVLVLYYPIKYIISNSSKLYSVLLLISFCLPMYFDQALNDLIFPVFLIMLKLCFSNSNASDEV